MRGCLLLKYREHSLECPSLRRHQRGAETAAGVPYDSVEEPKKNPLEREELKHRWYQKPEENPSGQNVREGRRSQARWGS